MTRVRATMVFALLVMGSSICPRAALGSEPGVVSPPTQIDNQPLFSMDVLSDMEEECGVGDGELHEVIRPMMIAAISAFRRKAYASAEEQLEEIQLVAHDYYPAYVFHAWLCEAQGNTEGTKEAWKALADVAKGTCWEKFALAKKDQAAAYAARIQNRVASSSPPPPGATEKEGEVIPPEPLPASYYVPFTPGEYRLSVGDVVEISVFGHRDTIFDQVPVAPDGRIYYLFQDEGVEAAGRLPEEVAADIEENIQSLFNMPEVSVIPTRFSSNYYLVYGKVNRPGVYPLNTVLTLRQAIATAGGLAQGIYRGSTIEIASLNKSYLIRDGEKLEVDFKSLLQGNDVTQDIYMRPGDIIYIASGLGEQGEVYLLGRVKKPKAVAYSDGMSVITLMAGGSELGGGVLESADMENVFILRGQLENPEMLEVNVKNILEGKDLNVYLVPGDIVYVPEKRYQYVRDLAKRIVLVFVKTFMAEFASDIVEQNLLPTSDTKAEKSDASEFDYDEIIYE